MPDTPDLKNIKDMAPNNELVSLLEGKLEDAKTGKLRSCIFVNGWHDDTMTHSWAHDPRNSPRRLLSEMVLMQHDFIVNIEMFEQDSILYAAVTGEDVDESS